MEYKTWLRGVWLYVTGIVLWRHYSRHFLFFWVFLVRKWSTRGRGEERDKKKDMSFVYILKNYLCLTTHPPFLPFFLSSHLYAMHINLMGLSKLNTERIWKKKPPMYFFEKKNEKMKKRKKGQSRSTNRTRPTCYSLSLRDPPQSKATER